MPGLERGKYKSFSLDYNLTSLHFDPHGSRSPQYKLSQPYPDMTIQLTICALHGPQAGQQLSSRGV